MKATTSAAGGAFAPAGAGEDVVFDAALRLRPFFPLAMFVLIPVQRRPPAS
jgi:hypothetical protein